MSIHVCTFFGHRQCPESIRSELRKVLIDLIEKQNVTMFYVGRNGAFDRIVRSVLRELSKKYPRIRYAVVLERIPEKTGADFSDTVFPEGLENVPPRFAIDHRNRWMLGQADYVVTYVRHPGGAEKYAELAARHGKTVVPLASRVQPEGFDLQSIPF